MKLEELGHLPHFGEDAREYHEACLPVETARLQTKTPNGKETYRDRVRIIGTAVIVGPQRVPVLLYAGSVQEGRVDSLGSLPLDLILRYQVNTRAKKR